MHCQVLFILCVLCRMYEMYMCVQCTCILSFFLQENDLSIGSLLGMDYTWFYCCPLCLLIIMFYTLWIDFLVSPEKDQNKTAPLPLTHVSFALCLLEILTYVQHVLFHAFNGRACDGMNVCYICTTAGGPYLPLPLRRN